MPEDEIWKISKYCAKMIFICSLIFIFLLEIYYSYGVKYPVPVHSASSHPLDTKKIPVRNLEVLEKSTATLMKKTE